MTYVLPGCRYHLLEALGAGSIGTLYRAFDRLDRQEVAFQYLPPQAAADPAARLKLARQLRALIPLRHPHLLSVLDYGFDTHTPYVVLPLLRAPQTLLDHGYDQPLAQQVALLLQALQALAYLHRHGVAHCALQPTHVLVDDGRVYLLNFGLAPARGPRELENAPLETLAFMAPEVLQGAPASPAADLYALGMMAYTLFAGQYPLRCDDPQVLIEDALMFTPEVDALDIDIRLRLILARLLAKDPHERDVSADDISALYAEARPQTSAAVPEKPLPVLALPLTGRDTQLETLSDALQHTLAGAGSLWLVLGGGGMGKSRLLDEIALHALSAGALVLRGYAAAAASAPYALWLPILRALCLRSALNDREASVLKGLIPDIDALLERAVDDAPPLDPPALRDRLLETLTALFARQTQPLVVLLDDLQWAGSSLELLSRLAPLLENLPLLLVAACDSEAAPDVSAALPSACALHLPGLDAAAVEALCAAALDPCPPAIFTLLYHETRGSPFLLLENLSAAQQNVRASGQLPATIFTGDLATVVQRRLALVPPSARPLLKSAAALGTTLDLKVLRLVGVGVDLETWLTQCADAGVLENIEGGWRFRHEMLRLGLLRDLPENRRRHLHQQAARKLEIAYPPREQTAALAYHWTLAGESGKAAIYLAQAGGAALERGLHSDAVDFLQRALRLNLMHPAKAQRQLADALYGLGRFRESRLHLEQALALMGCQIPRSGAGLLLRIGLHTLRQIVNRLLPFLSGRSRRSREQALDIARAHLLLQTLTLHENRLLPNLYSLNFSANLLESIAPSPERLHIYAQAAYLYGLGGGGWLSETYYRLAARGVEALPPGHDQLRVYLLLGLYHSNLGELAAALPFYAKAQQSAEALGALRQYAQAATYEAHTRLLLGEAQRALTINAFVSAALFPPADAHGQVTGRAPQMAIHLYMDRLEQAAAHSAALQTHLMQELDTASEIWGWGVLALYWQKAGDSDQALDCAVRALELMRASQPLAAWTLDGYACAAETFLLLWHALGYGKYALWAREALDELRQFAWLFPFARPRYALLKGLYQQLHGQTRQAQKTWQKGLRTAHDAALRLDEARLCQMLAAHWPEGEKRRLRYLARAAQLFDAMTR
ncbi:MAG: AAA family ATPase [Chloroflexi bacterium]|nr:AAA family ATPase [Chloroflexota bacterium]